MPSSRFSNLYLRYCANFAPGTGYNNAARGNLLALATLGLDHNNIYAMPTVGTDFREAEGVGDDWTMKYLKGGEREEAAQVNIVHTHAKMLGHFWTAGMYNVACFVWETDALPKATWRDEFDEEHTVVGDLLRYDEIWVPTRHVARMLEHELGEGPTSIHVIPHALVPGFEGTKPERDKVTDFYTIGAWNARKDPEALVRAYLSSSWRPTDPVHLSLYCVPPNRDPMAVMAQGNLAAQALQLMVDAGCSDPLGAPGRGLHTIYVPWKKVVARHLAGDVFVSTSHGEGFGLCPLEAVAAGNWVIGGGPWLEELAEVAGTVATGGAIDLLPYRKVPVGTVPDAWGYEHGQNWWDIDAGDLLNAMEAAHEGLQLAVEGRGNAEPQELSLGASEAVRAAYSPKAIGEKMAERLEAIQEVVANSGW